MPCGEAGISSFLISTTDEYEKILLLLFISDRNAMLGVL